MWESIIAEIRPHINVTYLVSFLALSYALRGPLNDAISVLYKKIFKKPLEMRKVYVVVLIAAILAIPFGILDKDEGSFMRLIVTYCVGTSLYEIGFKKIGEYIGGFFSKHKTDLESDTNEV